MTLFGTSTVVTALNYATYRTQQT